MESNNISTGVTHKLLITEKPSIAQEFANALNVHGRNNGYIENDKYIITWCVGHLVTLSYPEKYDPALKKWEMDTLPFLPDEYKYEVIDGVKEQFEVVKKQLNRLDVTEIINCGDAGREGEFIQRLVYTMAGWNHAAKMKRVWIDSYTKTEILRGIREAKDASVYDSLADAAYARSIEDYSIGLNFSRALTLKYGPALTNGNGYIKIAVGRVMTAVLAMIVRREREIVNFKKMPFFRVVCDLAEEHIEGEWRAVEGTRFFDSPAVYKASGFKEKEHAKDLVKSLEGQDGKILLLQKKVSKRKPPLLFNLAELQNECAKRFKIAPNTTLDMTQILYEKKLVTYPRTDARVLSTPVAREIENTIQGLNSYEPVSQVVEQILNERSYEGLEKTSYTNDAEITDHYAIIPTGETSEYESLSGLQKRIYDLIVRRFLSIFLPPAAYESIDIEVLIGGEHFFTQDKILIDEGFLSLISYETQKTESQLSEKIAKYKTGDILPINKLSIKKGETTPPRRYNSGNLILAMENAGRLIEDESLREHIVGCGIGTSATRAATIKKLVDNRYIQIEEKTQVVTPTNLGQMIFEVAADAVPDMLDPDLTAHWEEELQAVADSKLPQQSVLDKNRDYVISTITKIKENDHTQEMVQKIRPYFQVQNETLKAKCPLCGGTIKVLKEGYGCANYKKSDDNSCRFYLKNEIKGKKITPKQAEKLLGEGKTDLISGFESSKENKKFDAFLCLRKNEEGRMELSFSFPTKEDFYLPDVRCPECSSPIRKLKMGYACSSYSKENPDSCKFYIGAIAGKLLTESQVKILLKTGKTDIISGFKSKTGKTFAASLLFVPDEERPGKKKITFQLSNGELEGHNCPKCGAPLRMAPFGIVCSNRMQGDPNSCQYVISAKIAGKNLSEKQLVQLVKEGKTGVISGFQSKKNPGEEFSAKLYLDETGLVKFEFPKKRKKGGSDKKE